MNTGRYNGNGHRGQGDDFFRNLQDGFDQFLGQFRGNGKWLGFGALLFIVILGVSSSFYSVDLNEEAVVLRLGKYIKTAEPGLHFKIPFGIDRTYILKTGLVKRAEFGFRTSGTRDGRTTYSKGAYATESLMLTGDLNVADVEWIVQYQIKDPKKWLFSSKSPERNISDISQSMMRRVVGDRSVTETLTTGKAEIQDQVKIFMQEILDKYDIGVDIRTVELQNVDPPEMVKASFNEVNSAKQEQEKLINQAEEEYNKVIPKARGEAERTISEAKGFAEEIVNRAKGDANRFEQVLVEYRKAPAITKKRMYLETLEDLYKRFNKLTIVDPQVKGLLPVFRGGVAGGEGK